MRRSAEPLTAATTSILKPALRGAGFEPLSGRSFGRLRGDVLHFVDLQLSGFGSKQFCVNFAAMTLFPPRDHVVLDLGGRLRRGRSEAWWPSGTRLEAGGSMTDVVDRVRSQLLPQLRRLDTVEAFVAALQSPAHRSNAHRVFELACCLTRLNRLQPALKAADRASRLYEKSYAEVPARTWCLDQLKLVAELVRAIRDGSSAVTLDVWRRSSYARLKLSRLTNAA